MDWYDVDRLMGMDRYGVDRREWTGRTVDCDVNGPMGMDWDGMDRQTNGRTKG